MAYDASDYDLAGAFEEIERELIDSMMRNMKRHQNWEQEEGFNWTQWQVEQLRDLERYRKANKDKFPKEFEKLNDLISEAITQARATGQADQEVAILEAIQMGWLKGKRPDADVAGRFFRQNDRKMDALIKATTKDMEKAEYAILRKADDEYRKIVYKAVVIANTGGMTYDKCIDMATKDMRRAGLQCVEFKNGARHRLEDYADMVVRTVTKRAYLTGEGEKRREWGISTVIVNKRATACPKCLPWTGKVFIDDVWSGGRAGDGKYPLLSSAMAEGLYHPRCKDSHTTYFPGISTADDKWTKKELENLEKANRAEAKQQQAERQAKSHERQAVFALDPEEKKTQEALAEQSQKQAEIEAEKYAKIVEGYEDEAIPRQSVDMAERRRRRLAERRVSMQAETISEGIDFSAMTRDELESYIQDNLQTEFTGLQGANTDYIREAAKVMSEFESRFGGSIEGLKIQFGGTPAGVYAKYDDATKTLLLKKTGSIEKYEESLRKENARFRAKWHKDQDYHATDTYSGTIWHELGHAVDIESGQEYSRRLSATSALDKASVKVSAYAGSTQNIRATRRSEAWAENFAAYMDVGKNKKKVPDSIKDMIDGISFERKGNKERLSLLGKIQTGGRETGGRKYLPFDPSNPRDIKAADAYRKISREYDAERIAGSTNFTVEEIIAIKRHIFFDKHKLYDDYGPVVPDYDIAIAWKRLQQGKPEPRDILLLQHELLESQLEKEYNLDLAGAHALANKQYNWEAEMFKLFGEEGEPYGIL